MNALYAFSGDPITRGHLDLIERAYRLFPNLTIGIGVNPEKKYTFTLEERLDMVKHCTKHLPNIKVVSYTGLLVDFVYENNIDVVIRGIRNSKDLNDEYTLHLAQKSQGMQFETIPLFTAPEFSHVSSSVVKAMTKEQGKLISFVPMHVKQKLEEKMLGQYIISVTGTIGSGKSYVTEKFVELGKAKGIEVHNIDLDKISHDILSTLKEPKYVELRETIVKKFGEAIRNPDGSINRKILGEIVFNDPEKLAQLDELMQNPLEERMRREMYNKKGIILINAALLLEKGLLHYSNNNILIMTVNEEKQHERLKLRGLTEEQISHRVSSQLR
ncbi:MAG: pantetheine-phosphate adenylyltransferase [Clostridia bacterium]|nr:pantetheine-phosphate adenylyltransferase [Clostridia bacterium]